MTFSVEADQKSRKRESTKITTLLSQYPLLVDNILRKKETRGGEMEKRKETEATVEIPPKRFHSPDSKANLLSLVDKHLMGTTNNG